MTVEFMKDKIMEIESLRHEPFAGYISPDGELIDFTVTSSGTSHDRWNHPVSQCYMAYVSYILKGTSSELKRWKAEAYKFPNVINPMIEAVEYPGLDDFVVRGFKPFDFDSESFDEFINRLNDSLKNLIKKRENFQEYNIVFDTEIKFKYDLLLFFERAYKNRTFFETVGRQFYGTSKKDFLALFPWVNNYDSIIQKKVYQEFLREELMKYFKDIVVSYLGYDSIERYTINGIPIEWLKLEKGIEKDKFDSFNDYWRYCRALFRNYKITLDLYFDNNPRVITSSCFNPNERYFNWQIMNYVVHRVPKYNYNNETGMFELLPDVSTFHERHSEEILGKEIASIRRLVPLNERYKYFIK